MYENFQIKHLETIDVFYLVSPVQCQCRQFDMAKSLK